MKKQFTVSVDVYAYCQEDAQAKVDALLQMGAFVKDFNVNNLGSALINSYLISTASKIAYGRKPIEEKPLIGILDIALVKHKQAANCDT